MAIKGTLAETDKLAALMLNAQQLNVVESVLESLDVNVGLRSLEVFWEADAMIGGVGGYCLPAESIHNPYPSGTNRSLYRPLQYAREMIELSKLNSAARFVVEFVGIHLEEATRLLLAENSLLSRVRRYTLGQTVSQLVKAKALSPVLTEGLYTFVPIFNKAKHEVNQEEDRARLFSLADALIVYLSGRVMGRAILMSLKRTSGIDLGDSNRWPECFERAATGGNLGAQ